MYPIIVMAINAKITMPIIDKHPYPFFDNSLINHPRDIIATMHNSNLIKIQIINKSASIFNLIIFNMKI